MYVCMYATVMKFKGYSPERVMKLTKLNKINNLELGWFETYQCK